MSCAFCRVAALFLFCGPPSCPLPLTLLLLPIRSCFNHFWIFNFSLFLPCFLWIGEFINCGKLQVQNIIQNDINSNISANLGRLLKAFPTPLLTLVVNDLLHLCSCPKYLVKFKMFYFNNGFFNCYFF